MERLIDKDKVIKGIEICSGITKESNEECPYWKALDMGCKSATCISTMMMEARTLLKRQDKTGRWVKMTGMMPPEYHGHYECSECGWHGKAYDRIETRFKHCPECGTRMVNGDV